MDPTTAEKLETSFFSGWKVLLRAGCLLSKKLLYGLPFCMLRTFRVTGDNQEREGIEASRLVLTGDCDAVPAKDHLNRHTGAGQNALSPAEEFSERLRSPDRHNHRSEPEVRLRRRGLRYGLAASGSKKKRIERPSLNMGQG